MSEIATYAAVVMLLVVGVLGAAAAFSGATLTYAESETLTVGSDITYGTATNVSASQTPVVAWLDNETVTNATGSALTEGTDYDWNTSSGELTLYNTSATSDGEDVTIDYWYEAHSDRSQATKSVLALTYRVLGAGLLIGAAVVVGRWSSWIGGGR